MTDLPCITIVASYLAEHGYGGLCSEVCGCTLDDLGPCDDFGHGACSLAYVRHCDGCPHNRPGHRDDCPVDDGPLGTYCVGPTRDYQKARGDD